MTLQTSGQIAVSDVNQEIGQAANYSADLNFLNGLIKSNIRPTSPNMGSFYGLTYFKNNNQGNCNNGNNGAYGNCNCGQCNCNTANCTAINCANCDAQNWLQANCNCACTYNCDTVNCFTHDCNCSKIICTKLHSLGLLPTEIFLADQEFGAKLIKERPDIYNGYRAWAEIVVDWMDGSGPNILPWLPESRSQQILKDWAIAWAKDIATPWAEEMAYSMGKTDQGSITGKMLTAAGIPICKAVGLWQRLVGPSTKPAGFIKGISLVAVFVAFRGIVAVGQLFETLKFKGVTA